MLGALDRPQPPAKGSDGGESESETQSSYGCQIKLAHILISSYPHNFISSYPGNKVLPCWKWLEETLSRCCNGGLTAAPPAALPFMASLDSQI